MALYNNFIIRHAETEGEKLSEQGRQNAYDFGKRLYEWYGPNCVINVTTSPLQRAKDTGRHILEGYKGSGLESLAEQYTVQTSENLAPPKKDGKVVTSKEYTALTSSKDSVIYDTSRRFDEYIKCTLKDETTIQGPKQIYIGVTHVPSIDFFEFVKGIKDSNSSMTNNLEGINYGVKVVDGKKYFAIREIGKDLTGSVEKLVELEGAEHASQKQSLDAIIGDDQANVPESETESEI